MTEDYKKRTLEYITGTLTPGSKGSNSFRDTPIYNNNFSITCQNEYGFTPSTIMYLTTDTTSNFIIYGTYDDNGTYRGYIAVLNQNGEIETVFTAFNTGTKLGYLEKLRYDENGNIYGIDTMNDKLRVILLNNVALKTVNGYTCRLRNSYYVPDDYSTFWVGWDYDVPGYIKKAKDKATYYLFGVVDGTGEGTSNVRPALIKFVINVGSSNEWTAYIGSNFSENIMSSDFYIEEGNENDTVVGLLAFYAGIKKCELVNGTFSEVENYGRPTGSSSFDSIRIINKNSFYACTRGSDYSSKIYRYDDDAYTLINSRPFETSDYRRFLCYINGILFDKIRYYNTETEEGHTYIGVYDGSSYISAEISFVYKNSPLEVINNYGLYQLIIQDENKLVKPSYVNYQPAYSGSSYVDYNSVVPLHSELYSNGNLVYARNLYNRNVYGNTTVSTAEIPNGFLNDIPIQPKNLISATMTTLASDTEEFTKNIYENVFVNFTNKLYVEDEDLSREYPQTANYINVGINTGTELDYEGTMIGRIRINYTDNTALDQFIGWSDISSGNLIAKETNFSLYVSKPISSIEFMNKDGTFTYIAKTYTLEVGKTYTISQKIRIE